MSRIARDIEALFAEAYAEIEADMISAGEDAVQYNVENGDYNNITGNLRRSNFYEITYAGDIPGSLVIGNTASYASDVESRGRMVVSGGVLLAQELLDS